MPIIFKAKTREGYALKVLAELLQNNLKTACFEIDGKGIRLRMMDNHRTVLIDLELDADSFSLYKYELKERMYLGINLTHLHKMLKSIKKRDSLQLFIDDACPTDLNIKVIPKENNRVTTSAIKILNSQNIDIELPTGYGKPVIVPSGEFQKMCKGLTPISNDTRVTARGFKIRFSSNAGEVMKRSTDFGEAENSNSEPDDDKQLENNVVIDYCEEFVSDQLTRLTKLAGLGKTIQIYPKRDKPLLFRSSVENLGKISIYLKSKSTQDNESRSVDLDADAEEEYTDTNSAAAIASETNNNSTTTADDVPSLNRDEKTKAVTTHLSEMSIHGRSRPPQSPARHQHQHQHKHNHNISRYPSGTGTTTSSSHHAYGGGSSTTSASASAEQRPKRKK